MDEVIHEASLTVTAIVEVQVTLAVLVPLLPFTLIVLLVVIHLDSSPILSVLFELPLIDAS